jgi:hypothetical protein
MSEKNEVSNATNYANNELVRTAPTNLPTGLSAARHPWHISKWWWLEAIPTPDICALLTGSISRFGCPWNHHHRPRTSLPFPGQIVWNSTFPDNHPPPHSQRTRGTLQPDTDVPRRPGLCPRRTSSGSTRNKHSFVSITHVGGLHISILK